MKNPFAIQETDSFGTMIAKGAGGAAVQTAVGYVAAVGTLCAIGAVLGWKNDRAMKKIISN